MRCRIRFRLGDLIAALDEGICDADASATRKTKTGNQTLGVVGPPFLRFTTLPWSREPGLSSNAHSDGELLMWGLPEA
jgi:hypothetical protein